MKKALQMMFLLVVMVCALCISAGAEELSGTCGAEGDGSNVTWALDTETGVLTISGTGAMKNYSFARDIPWYEQRTFVRSAVVGGGVTFIGYSAFSDCSSLTAIELPKGVTSIGDDAFYGCSSLAAISLPEGVASIGYRAFSGCSSLTAIELPESVTSIGDRAFSGCSSLVAIELPKDVTSIGERTFSVCSNLTAVELPKELTVIGKSAFFSCSALTEVVIPEKVITIEEGAFEYCSKLKTLSLPQSVKTIQINAFASCRALEEVYYGGSQEDWDAMFVGNNNEPLLNAKRYVGGVLQPGKADLSGAVSGLSSGATAFLMQGGAELAQAAVVNGSFTFKDLPAGTYDVVIKCPACLNCAIQGIVLSGEDVALASVSLVYGDLNGDQKINIADMGIFRQNFGKTAEKDCTVTYA